MMKRERVVIHSAEYYSNSIQLEQIHYGKVFKLINGMLVIICGDGKLILATKISSFDNKTDIRISRLKTRFYKPSTNHF